MVGKFEPVIDHQVGKDRRPRSGLSSSLDDVIGHVGPGLSLGPTHNASFVPLDKAIAQQLAYFGATAHLPSSEDTKMGSSSSWDKDLEGGAYIIIIYDKFSR